MEAEYIAMSQPAKRLMTIYGLALKFIRMKSMPIVYLDSSAALCAAESEVSKSLKHLYRLEYHFVHQAFVSKELELHWVSTKDQIADTLTKALPKSSFKVF